MLPAMRRIANLVALALAFAQLAACGGRQVAEPSEEEPPWVKDYERIAREACACPDDEDCLNDAHARAVAMEDAHGGIDDAPPSVQIAHGELDKCWREGTYDLARDVTSAVDAVCACSESACIDLYRLDVIHISQKYKVDLSSPDALDPASRESVARASACIAKVSIPAEEYLSAYQGRADAVCKCETRHCAETSPRIDFGERFYVDLAAVKAEADVAAEKYCDCMFGFVAKELKAEMDQAEGDDKKKIELPREMSIDPQFRCPPPK
jgi:hypothetical protein